MSQIHFSRTRNYERGGKKAIPCQNYESKKKVMCGEERGREGGERGNCATNVGEHYNLSRMKENLGIKAEKGE